MSTDPEAAPVVPDGPLIMPADEFAAVKTVAAALDGFWLHVACGGQRVHGQVADPDEVASVLLATLGRIAAEGSADGPTIDGEPSGEAGASTHLSEASPRHHGQARPRTGPVDALPVAAAFDPERIRDVLAGTPAAEQADAVMLEVIGPLLESAHAAGAEPAPARLTDAQCDRLRQMTAEYGDALSAVRRALDLTAALDDADREIIAAGRAGLKVLEGAEEDAAPVAADLGRTPRLCPTCLHDGVLDRVLDRAERAEERAEAAEAEIAGFQAEIAELRRTIRAINDGKYGSEGEHDA